MSDLVRSDPIIEGLFDPPMLDEWLADPRALVWRGPTGDVAAVSRRRDDALEVLITSVAVFILEDGRATPTARIHHDDPALLLDLYRRFALPIFLQARGAEVMHASAVLGPRGVIAFSGPSGSGKSTLAWVLADRGYSWWADDTLVFERSSDRFISLKLPSRPRLCRDAADQLRLPAPPPPDISVARAELAAIVVLDRGDVDSPELVRLTAKESFLTLFTQAFSFDLTARDRYRSMLDTYFDLAERVPVHRLTHRPSFDELQRLIELVERAIVAPE